MNPNNLNLYIVENDLDYGKSLAAMFVACLDGVAVQSFESGEAFIENAHIDASGVVILDLRLEEDTGQLARMTGLEVFRALKDRQSPLVVIFLSGHGTIPDVVNAMQDGAVSWLQKIGSVEVLMSTVQVAKEKAMGIAARRKAAQALQVRWSKLTDREKEVAPLVAQGKSAKIIGRLLTEKDPIHPIASRTVEGYRANIFAKLEVANASELQKLMDEYGPD